VKSVDATPISPISPVLAPNLAAAREEFPRHQVFEIERWKNSMKRTNQTIKMSDIKGFVMRVAQTFKPQKIILFGSYAYGKPEEASDADILVVMDTPLRSVDQAITIRKTIKASFPLDLIVRTPQQIEERLSQGDFFLREVLTKGKILYEASD